MRKALIVLVAIIMIFAMLSERVGLFSDFPARERDEKTEESQDQGDHEDPEEDREDEGEDKGESEKKDPAGDEDELKGEDGEEGANGDETAERDRAPGESSDVFMLGSEVLLSRERHLVEDKKVGLVTNQSGVNSKGESTIELLWEAGDIELVALYAPEHGIDGKALAGEYVQSYTHEEYGIPVYSLYGATRMPTEEMLEGIDILLFDIQDIGARSYTYISTLNYCMVAAARYGLPLVVLDRPNPLGGVNVGGPVMEERFISFVGVDIMPKAHGMTMAELALYFNREIGADLVLVPMEGYHRSMIFQDTGLSWVITSPNIPDLEAVFGYLVTGLGEGTGVYQADKFRWIGGRGLDSQAYATALNAAGLRGVEFIADQRNEAGGVRLNITDYHSFDPARTGIYALALAFKLGDFRVPKSNATIVMFDKIMGTDRIGRYLEEGLNPGEIEALIAPAVDDFKQVREQYLLPQYSISR